MSSQYKERVAKAEAAIEQDADLIICSTCGMQYPVTSPSLLIPPDACTICLDDRQYVGAGGQSWTSIRKLREEKGLEMELVAEKGDQRIRRIVVKGGSVGIGQTPILLITSQGLVIWDCSGLITPSLCSALFDLCTSFSLPLLGITISHPHFYNSSLTWAKALKTKIFVSEKDREWWFRKEEESQTWVEFWEGDVRRIAKGVDMVRCGGHFPGSCVLIWDRGLSPGPSSLQTPSAPTSGLCLCSDTFMPAPDKKTFSFLYSYPNLIPLPPTEVEGIWKAVRPYQFEDVYGSWPGRDILGGARTRVRESAKKFVRMEGWDEGRFAFDD